MRNSKISLGNSDYRLWILAFGTSILLLMAVWRSCFGDQVSALSEDLQYSSNSNSTSTNAPSKGHGYPPILAYWICGTNGDGKRMLRLLKAIYHPRNQYLLQLDAESLHYESAELLVSIQSERVFGDMGNVNVVGKSYSINRVGSSALAATLHAAALLLKLNKDWEWFINLSPADYPLMTQDDLLHAFTSLPRDLNFIHFSGENDWKERRNVDQIVIDPSLYLQKSSDLFYTVERRTPDAFDIFGGSAWMILTRSLMEYCVQGWDNLPRKLVMYFSNVACPLESYFHTVICNSAEFQNTTLNTDLRYNVLKDPSINGIGDESHRFYDKLLASGATFARPFKQGDSLLDKVDHAILNRPPNGVVPGNWCSGEDMNLSYSSESWNLCASWGNIDTVKPGSPGIRLALLLSKLQVDAKMRTSPCHQ